MRQGFQRKKRECTCLFDETKKSAAEGCDRIKNGIHPSAPTLPAPCRQREGSGLTLCGALQITELALQHEI